MKFGEKVRLLRNEKKLSQTELGKMCGLSLRTIRNYEVDGRYPKQREVYAKLATALGCEINFLLSEDEEFVLQALDLLDVDGHGALEAQHVAGVHDHPLAGGQIVLHGRAVDLQEGHAPAGQLSRRGISCANWTSCTKTDMDFLQIVHDFRLHFC